MKAYLNIEIREDCPEESSGEYQVLDFRCSLCGAGLTKPPYEPGRPTEERIKDPRTFTNLWHPLEKVSFGGHTEDVSSCVNAGKYFEGPLVELREITGP